MLRGAVIGFGEVARRGHAPAYAVSNEAKIVAVVDSTEERRQVARECLPGVQIFSTIADMAEGAEIDFVDICTPPALHGDPMLEALGRGWNVLCEKPLVLDLVELEKVRGLALENERAVVPVHNWKYAPIIRQATQLLRAGAIGPLHRVEIETLRIHDCAAADPNHPNWRLNPVMAGGGVLMDHGWHAVYLARDWFGEDPIEVEASLKRPTPDAVENEATLALEFPSGRAEIFLTWKAKARRNMMRLLGEYGEIAIDDDRLQVRGETIPFDNALSAGSHHADWFEAMLPDVIASFRAPKSAQAAFQEAALCLSVIRRAYEVDRSRSARST